MKYRQHGGNMPFIHDASVWNVGRVPAGFFYHIRMTLQVNIHER